MFAWVNTSPLNIWAGEPAGAGAAPGKSRIITVHPLPDKAAGFLNIVEYGRPFVRDHRGLQPSVPRKRPQSMEERGYYRTFCRECPFKLMMNVMKERHLSVICDAGCSVLAMTQPYELGLASYGMGASIAVAARSTHVALIGDYALLHSGLNALIDVYEKELPLLTVIMKNNCTAMTGMQAAYDPIRYLSFAEPVVCCADEEQTLKKELVVTGKPRTIVVEGNCPTGCCHETVEY
jgi:TPP-dependent indolepyruvate ferredoxin oxidoreductase alpha subunit